MSKTFKFKKLTFEVKTCFWGLFEVVVTTSQGDYTFYSNNTLAYDRCDCEQITKQKSYQRELYYEYKRKCWS